MGKQYLEIDFLRKFIKSLLVNKVIYLVKKIIDLLNTQFIELLFIRQIEANYLIYGIKKPNMISFINTDSQNNIKNSF